MRVPSAAFVFGVLLVTALAACGATTTTAGKPPTRAAAVASPTPPAYKDLTLSVRAIVRDDGDMSACTSIGERAHVATIAQDFGTDLADRAFGAPSARCVREVRAGDSAYAGATAAAIYIPHARVARALRESYGLASRPATSVATCIAAGKHARTPTVAFLSGPPPGYAFDSSALSVSCFRSVASDDSAADSTTRIVVQVPAREVTP